MIVQWIGMEKKLGIRIISIWKILRVQLLNIKGLDKNRMLIRQQFLEINHFDGKGVFVFFHHFNLKPFKLEIYLHNIKNLGSFLT